MNKLVFLSIFLPSIELIVARPQQSQIDPAYLRDYYAQQQNVHRGSVSDATPIFEQNSGGFQPSSSQAESGQQIRLRDSVQEQIRAQQQQSQYIVPTVRQYTQQQFQPQYQQQAIQYNRPQTPSKQTLAIPRKQQLPQTFHPAQNSGLNRDEEEDDSNSSYQFGFDVKDDEYTNYQNRKEVRDGNVIKGSYSVVDSDGFIRTVTYTADPKEGFKADVVREPTDIVVKIPAPAQENSISNKFSKPQQHFLPQQTQYRNQATRQQQLRQQQADSQQYQYE